MYVRMDLAAPPVTFRARRGLNGSMDVPRPTPVTFAIGGPITRADLPGLCDRVCTLLEAADADVVLCDVRGVTTDVVTVDALARLQLAARRRGCHVVLQHAPDDLRRLVAFLGLADVLVEG
jgi:ABC-type transporter Mla MlaB component